MTVTLFGLLQTPTIGRSSLCPTGFIEKDYIDFDVYSTVT
jgi:hypothetical protein